MVAYRDGPPLDGEPVAAICRAMQHRGPDGHGFLRRANVQLGHVRLSIIDVAGGQQPMSNEDDSVHVVFNGEIYNYLDLRPGLEAKGHVFKTNCDTEVLVHLYEEHGRDLADHLIGEFAFAIWDDRRQALLLVRDRLGVKPVYYADLDGVFLFASEFAPLIASGQIPRQIDARALQTYFQIRTIPAPRSIYKDVHKLPSGHRLEIRNGAVVLSCYWDIHFEPDERRSEGSFAEEVRALVDDSVKRQLMSEVPLGAFLSGGVDSSAVVTSMVRYSTTPVKTFSIGLKDHAYDESRFYKLVAQRLGVEHHEFIFEPDLVNIIPKLVYHFGEPCAIGSALPLYYLARLAREHVTVALSGDGGDEIFAGYNTYNYVNWLRLIDAVAGRLVGSDWFGAALHRCELPTTSRLGNALRRLRKIQRLVRLPASRRMCLIGNLGDFGESLLVDEVDGEAPPEYVAAFERGQRPGDWLAPYLYADQKVLLPEEMFVKLDRMTMANGMEGRVPLCDYRIVELAARIPARLKLKRGRVKSIFKQAMQPRLPAEVLRRPKVGFRVPLDEWFRGPLRQMVTDLLTDSGFRQSGLFNHPAVAALVRQHMASLDNHGNEILALLMFELWRRNLHARETWMPLREWLTATAASAP
jgi:asparagine synthase (glutamine-hydrolysing)